MVVNECGEGKVIKQVGEELPDVGVPVLPQAFVVEAVDLGDLSALVVASEDGDPVSVPDLERDEQGDRLDRIVPSVDVIAHEKVIGVRRIAADPEQLREIVLCAIRRPCQTSRLRQNEESEGRRTN